MKLCKNAICFLLAILSASCVIAQKDSSIVRYIRTYKDAAISEMQRTGIPAAITLAQGIHESGAGQSDLVVKSNNHFGIKCKNSWTGRTVYHDDDAKGECFRAYDSPIDSYRDHSDFLKGGDRYAFLFLYEPTDYNKWAYGLKLAGYATNPKYPQILIKLIEDNHLNDYTLIAMGKMPINSLVNRESSVVNVSQIGDPTHDSRLATHAVYPTGVFIINKTKVIFAAKGTSLLALAQQQQVALPEMLVWNDMEQQQVLDQDQLVYLQKKQRKGATETHVVKANETLWVVSQVEGIRLVDLLQYNLLSENDEPTPGKILNLQNYIKTTASLF